MLDRTSNDAAPPGTGEPVQLRCISSDRAGPEFDRATIERMKREALQIAVPILAMAGALFWLARRRGPPPPSPGAGS